MAEVPDGHVLNHKGLLIRNHETHRIRPDLAMTTGEFHDFLFRISDHQPPGLWIYGKED